MRAQPKLLPSLLFTLTLTALLAPAGIVAALPALAANISLLLCTAAAHRKGQFYPARKPSSSFFAKSLFFLSLLTLAGMSVSVFSPAISGFLTNALSPLTPLFLPSLLPVLTFTFLGALILLSLGSLLRTLWRTKPSTTTDKIVSYTLLALNLFTITAAIVMALLMFSVIPSAALLTAALVGSGATAVILLAMVVTSESRKAVVKAGASPDGGKPNNQENLNEEKVDDGAQPPVQNELHKKLARIKAIEARVISMTEKLPNIATLKEELRLQQAEEASPLFLTKQAEKSAQIQLQYKKAALIQLKSRVLFLLSTQEPLQEAVALELTNTTENVLKDVIDAMQKLAETDLKGLPAEAIIRAGEKQQAVRAYEQKRAQQMQEADEILSRLEERIPAEPQWQAPHRPARKEGREEAVVQLIGRLNKVAAYATHTAEAAAKNKKNPSADIKAAHKKIKGEVDALLEKAEKPITVVNAQWGAARNEAVQDPNPQTVATLIADTQQMVLANKTAEKASALLHAARNWKNPAIALAEEAKNVIQHWATVLQNKPTYHDVERALELAQKTEILLSKLDEPPVDPVSAHIKVMEEALSQVRRGLEEAADEKEVPASQEAIDEIGQVIQDTHAIVARLEKELLPKKGADFSDYRNQYQVAFPRVSRVIEAVAKHAKEEAKKLKKVENAPISALKRLVEKTTRMKSADNLLRGLQTGELSLLDAADIAQQLAKDAENVLKELKEIQAAPPPRKNSTPGQPGDGSLFALAVVVVPDPHPPEQPLLQANDEPSPVPLF